MKRLTFVAGLIASVACFGLQAQSWRLTASVPFPFQAGGMNLPAGEYRVSTTSGVLTMRAATGGVVFIASLPESSVRGLEQGVLVFKKYGNEYFLSKVRVPDGYQGHSVWPTPREKELISRANRPETAVISAAIK